MLPDRVSNPGPLTYVSGALPIALRGPACGMKVTCFGKSVQVLLGQFSPFAIKSLQNNTSNTISTLNLKKT